MKTISLLLLSLASAFASDVYTASIPADATSFTVTASQHGFSTTSIAVDVHDSTGANLPTTAYSYTINSSTYEVDITFFTSLDNGGTLHLIGNFGSDTTNSTDFQLAVGSGKLSVCQYCNPARRTYNGRIYVMETESDFNYSTGSPVNVTVFAYIQDNEIVFGINDVSSNWSGAYASGPHTRLQFGVSSYPYGVVELGQVIWHGSYWGYVSDNRRTELQ